MGEGVSGFEFFRIWVLGTGQAGRLRYFDQAHTLQTQVGDGVLASSHSRDLRPMSPTMRKMMFGNQAALTGVILVAFVRIWVLTTQTL